MNWIKFKSKMFELGCFNVNQVYGWQKGFDRNNFSRWTQKGYLVRLRQGLYTFPEYKNTPGMAMYFAGQMYKPSYISLHSALSFYGVIPEAIMQITSVSSLKTAFFKNSFGEYSYKSVRPDLMFGYEPQSVCDGWPTYYAHLEKAILDLLYLYPFYNTETELVNLRFDKAVLNEDLDVERFNAYAEQFRSKALDKRVFMLSKVYDL